MDSPDVPAPWTHRRACHRRHDLRRLRARRKAVLEGIQGVTRAEVSLEKAQATVTYDPPKADVSRMKEAVTDAGYQVA